MRFLDFKPFISDPDTRLRPVFKVDSAECHEHVLLRADNASVIRENAVKFLRKELWKYFELRPKSAGLSISYIGDRAIKALLENIARSRDFSSSQSARPEEKSAEESLSKGSKTLDGESIHAKSNVGPKLSTSNKLTPKEAPHC